MTMRYWINNLLPRIVNRRISRRRHRSRLAAEVLEIRALLSTFTVSNIADSGLGSLRAAIDSANSNPGADTIDFDSSFNTAQTITLTGSQLEFFDADTTTIIGPNAGVTVTGGGLSRVFLVNLGSSASISGMTITGGSAENGGGLAIFGDFTLTNCSVSGNSATYDGGGIYNNGTVSLTECIVSDNSADRAGGGLWNGFNGSVTLTDSMVINNSAYGDFGGGGICSDGMLTLTDCTVSGNSASVNGGGLYLESGVATLTNVIISGNTAGNSGGGLNFWDAPSVTLTNCTVSGNIAAISGGGVMNFYSLAAFTNCTVSGNTAAYGGGLYNLSGMNMLTNTTVSGNSAAYGGGLYNLVGTTMLTNSTVSGNTATVGGGVYVAAGIATLTNTIVAGNTDLSGASDVSGNASGSYNLIGTGGSGGLLNGVDGNIVGVASALLAPLGDYGGPTQSMPLLPGSLAIGAGTDGAGIPDTDQRGISRVGAVDIGAFESQGFAFTLVTGSTPQTAIVGNAFDNALAVIVTANNPSEPVDGGVVTFAATPAINGASATLSGSPVISGGQASVTATANLIVGAYTVSAGATGAAVVSFVLNNVTTVVASATSVDWGTQTHVVAGRTNLPWANISGFVLTFASPVAPTIGDLTVIGRDGHVYNVSSVSVVGNTVTWTLTTPITAADIVTFTVNPLLAIYSIQLRILPGDVNDDSVVNAQDQVLVRNVFMDMGTPSLIPRAYFDLNGDGVVDVTDYNIARINNGKRL